MKLSIDNFKTIKELKDFTFNSINVISGVNSSGKTSFIQFLLLLKQTIEVQSANSHLVFDGNWIKLGCCKNVIYQKNVNNLISFELSFDGNDIDGYFQPVYGIEKIFAKIDYLIKNEECCLSKIRFSYKTPQQPRKEHFISFSSNNELFKLETDTALFGKEFMELIGKEGNLNLTSFMPSTFSTDIDNPDYPELDKNPNKRITIETKTKEIQTIISNFFENISYIGPLRAEPSDWYQAVRNKYIGNKGEYAAQFLEEESGKAVDFYQILNDGSIGHKQTMALSKAVKYWICDIFNLSKDIRAEKDNDRYVVKVINHYGVESTIRQVGFGISQVLPIIVEGLRMDKNGLLILEQPEIHLHPKVQSLLFDFIYSMSLTGKQFLIETHSDHFITRMRRRIAESNSDLYKNVNMVFVEQREAEHLFRKLDLSDMGTFSYFPDDFVEQSDDYDAIIMAQANKSLTKN
ncbi:MAG: AAA family ATPase [Tannerellaceae bacterium]|jgi:predicted ATPase|nr:AAA family ATPase [Tannerellaceae bacterium]